MILAFIEDGTIEIHDSPELAAAAYEGVDVESEVVVFYNEKGSFLKPVFTIPNKYGSFLGLFHWSESGSYRLELKDSADEEPLWVMFAEALRLASNGKFSSIKQLKQHLANKGVCVDNPDDA